MHMKIHTYIHAIQMTSLPFDDKPWTKRVLLVGCLWLFLFPGLLRAQMEPMYSQYIFNNTVINPAQAGASEQNQFGMLTRYQWLGFDNSPRTQSAYANLQLPRQMGLAVGIYQDKLGPEVRLQLQTDLAYHATLSDTWRLAGGVRLAMTSLRVALTDIPNVDQGDPMLVEDLKSGLLLNVGAGLLAYNDQSFIGLSMPRVFKSLAEVLVSQIGNRNPDAAILEKLPRQLVAYGGTNLPLTDEIQFMPSALFRIGPGSPTQIDINTVFGYADLLDFGPLVRSNLIDRNNYLEAVGFIVGIRFLPNLYFGYVYEYPLTSLNVVTLQSHEISLRLLLNPRQDRQIGSPRYFL